MTRKEWLAAGRKRVGEDQNNWKFKCPVCGHVASVQDYMDAGAPAGAIAFSCIGRWREGSREAISGKGPGPCNYSGGGLFKLNPLEVEGGMYFEFA